jgi:hypothetical protein
MYPANLLVTWSGVKVFQGGGAQAGDNCHIRVVSRIITHMFSEHCDSPISVPKSTGSFGLVADPSPSIGCVDKNSILKSYSAFHSFWDEDSRVPIMGFCRTEV